MSNKLFDMVEYAKNNNKEFSITLVTATKEVLIQLGEFKWIIPNINDWYIDTAYIELYARNYARDHLAEDVEKLVQLSLKEFK
jgi:hypothetical protein